MPKTRQSCNNRWGWRFLPSPLEFTEPRNDGFLNTTFSLIENHLIKKGP